jgi:hypothetical protein
MKINKSVKKSAKISTIKYISDNDKAELTSFVYFALGDPELSAYEANFIARLRQLCDWKFLWLSDKQLVIIEQIKQKLRYQLPPLEKQPIIDEEHITDDMIRNEADLYRDVLDLKE